MQEMPMKRPKTVIKAPIMNRLVSKSPKPMIARTIPNSAIARKQIPTILKIINAYGFFMFFLLEIARV
jgi:hypothetical protein